MRRFRIFLLPFIMISFIFLFLYYFYLLKDVKDGGFFSSFGLRSDPQFMVQSDVESAHYDRLERLNSMTGKIEVSCPKQTPEMGVFIVIGQSNSANHGDIKFKTQFPQKVLNYFDRKCYVASSPLLGSTGSDGEFITPLADILIQQGIFKSIVIISAGVAGSPISRWQAGGDLNTTLKKSLMLMKRYKITDIIWHQGESDFLEHTSPEAYRASFYSLKNSLRKSGVSAPFFIAIATKCFTDPTWLEENPIARSQISLADNKEIFVAANTDILLNDFDRQSDLCHLSGSGQIKVANAYADAIKTYHSSRKRSWMSDNLAP
jgi:hypothetical protein